MRPLTILIVFLPSCWSLHVLLYQIAFSRSHMPFSGAIADSLIDAGHVVDQIILTYNSDVKSNGSLRFRDVYRVELKNRNQFRTAAHITDPFNVGPLSRRNPITIKTRKDFCQRLFDDHELISKLRARNYDVFLSVPFDHCSLALRHVLKIPSMSVFSALAQAGAVTRALGVPWMPSSTTDIFECRTQSRPKNFWQRLWSFLYSADVNRDPDPASDEELRSVRSRFSDLPSVHEMIQSITYVFLNTNEILEIPQPLSNKFKYIGGITLKSTTQKLPQSITRLLDIPARGTIVFSFGSLIQSVHVPHRLKLELLRAFSEFPDYTFLWKLDEDDDIRLHLQNRTNVHALSWLPQVDLLNDPRVKVFISHMGLNSYIEGSQASQVFISIPFFIDQFLNADAAEGNGVGLIIEKQNLNYETMRNALRSVLFNPSYAENAKMIGDMLRDRKESPRDVLVHGIEYAARHPQLAKVLQLSSAGMPLWKYFCLDVIVFLLTSVLVIFVLISLVTRLTYRRVFSRKVKNE